MPCFRWMSSALMLLACCLCSFHSAAQGEDGASSSRWASVVDWTYSWDLTDAKTYDDDGADWSIPAALRVDTIPNGSGMGAALQRDAGFWGRIFKQKRVPGPKYVASSPRFNGRPAMMTDAIAPGGFGKIYALVATAKDPTQPGDWLNAPHGAPAPYWGAVLCRPVNGGLDKFGAWDAYNGHIGTTVTIARSLRQDKPLWGATTSLGLGDPWPSTEVEASDQQTVLVIARVDGEHSFLELNWRDAEGKIKTDRTTFTLKSYPAKEIFMGGVHTSYVSAAGLKTGVPDERELSAVRDWAAAWLPSPAMLPVEP